MDPKSSSELKVVKLKEPAENRQRRTPFAMPAQLPPHQDDSAQLNLREIWITVVLNSYLLMMFVMGCVSLTALYSAFVVEYRASAVMSIMASSPGGGGSLAMLEQLQGGG